MSLSPYETNKKRRRRQMKGLIFLWLAAMLIPLILGLVAMIMARLA